MLTPTIVSRHWQSQSHPYLQLRVVKDNSMTFEKHFHDCFSFGLVTEGSSDYWNLKQKQTIYPHDVVLINPEDLHACNPHAENWGFQMYYLDCNWLSELQAEMGLSTGSDFNYFSKSVIQSKQLTQQIYHTTQILLNEVDNLKQEEAIIELASLLSDCSHYGKFNRKLPSPLLLKEISEFLADTPEKQHSLKEICKTYSIGRSHLLQSFKMAFGVSPHAYQLNHRIIRAKQKLAQQQNITDIALDCGFYDQAHFQKTFKRFVGQTPKSFQNSLQTVHFGK